MNKKSKKHLLSVIGMDKMDLIFNHELDSINPGEWLDLEVLGSDGIYYPCSFQKPYNDLAGYPNPLTKLKERHKKTRKDYTA